MTKAIILAAGIATRLRPLTDFIPKCLLDVGGTTILGRALANLKDHGLTDVILVTGYREEQIHRFVRDNIAGIRVEFLSNSLYETTNNIYSLWMTQDLMQGHGMLLLDSDIIFDGRIIDRLFQSGHDDCLAVKTGLALGQEEIKVRVDTSGGILQIGKEIRPQDALGESIGIEKFGSTFVQRLFAELDTMVRVEKKVGAFYEAAFQRVIDAGRRPFIVDTGSLACIEIDTTEDLESARGLLAGLPESGR
jgi:choline kinase